MGDGVAVPKAEHHQKLLKISDFQRITTLEKYTNNMAGREIILGDEKDTTAAHEDGTMTRMFKGKSIVSTRD